MKAEWLSDLPPDWDTRRISWLGRMVGGGTPSKGEASYWDGDIPWASPKDMKRRVLTDTVDHISRSAVTNSSTTVVPPGSVLIVTRSGILRHSLPVAVTGTEMALNQDLKALIPADGVDADYLAYWMEAHNGLLLSIWRKEGTTVESIETDLIKQTPVPLPPIDTQRAIADFLDRETAKIDTLIEKKQRLMALLDEKRTALITRAVTRGLDPDVPMKDSEVEWIGEIPEHWDVTTLNRITSSSRPIRYGIVLPGPHDEDGVPIIKAGDVAKLNRRVGSLRRCANEIEVKHMQSRVYPGDLVYSIRGSFGAVSRVPENLSVANLTQDTARVVPDGVSTEWLLYMLRSEAVKRQLEAGVKGTAVKGVNIEDLRRAIIVVPSTREQQAISHYLDQELGELDAVRRHVVSATELLQEYRTAMISAAVTGGIDV